MPPSTPYPMKPTLEMLIGEAKRELEIRERVYPQWARDGKFGLTRELADYRIRAQRHIVRRLEGLRESDVAKEQS